MPQFLLDTNVISETARPAPEPRVIRWFTAQSQGDLFISAVTLGELFRGAAQHPDAVRRQKLEHWIDQDVLKRFKGHILAFDREAATIWGRILGFGDRTGRPRPPVDAQIAATAVRHGLVLATRNTQDHIASGLEVFNPWIGR